MKLEISKLDESCISNPKFRNPKLDSSNQKFRISDLRCRIRPISKFHNSYWSEYESIPAFCIPYRGISHCSGAADRFRTSENLDASENAVGRSRHSGLVAGSGHGRHTTRTRPQPG